jgi:phosphopantothenoylcysteine decarboxylase/phosphopantothenate--cysteine ligase
LVNNPDIIAELGKRRKKSGGKRPLLVGFALETEDLKKNALKKLRGKEIDIIIGNRSTRAKSVFGVTAAEILIADKKGGIFLVKAASKAKAAKIILDKVLSYNI